MSEPTELPGQTIATIDRAIDVLTLFTDPKTGEDLGVTDIAQRLGLSKAVVHRILATFRAHNYVELDEETRRYRLGPSVMHLGLAYVNRLDLRTMVRPVLEHLSQATGETATLSIRNGAVRSYVDQVAPRRDVRMEVQLGATAPLHAGASGKAFLAFMLPIEQQRYVDAGLEGLTTETPVDPRSLLTELAQIAADGFAQSRGERLPDAASIAAPILAHDGQPLAVISICGPRERFLDVADNAAHALLDATRGLSAQHGYRAAS